MEFQFVQPLGSDEFIGEVDGALKFLNGVEGVGGNSTTAKVTYWPAEVSEDASPWVVCPPSRTAPQWWRMR